MPSLRRFLILWFLIANIAHLGQGCGSDENGQEFTTTSSLNVPEVPIISAQSLQHENVIVLGDDVLVTCDVFTENPDAESVTLTCRGDTKNRDTAAQTLTMTRSTYVVSLVLHSVGVVDNMTHCSCKALPVNECHKSTWNLQLNVLEEFHGPIDSECQFKQGDLVGAVVGTILGTLCLGVIIYGAILCVSKMKFELWKLCGGSEEYDEVERRQHSYQNVTLPGETNYMALKLPHRKPNKAARQNYENTKDPVQNHYELEMVTQDHPNSSTRERNNEQPILKPLASALQKGKQGCSNAEFVDVEHRNCGDYEEIDID